MVAKVMCVHRPSFHFLLSIEKISVRLQHVNRIDFPLSGSVDRDISRAWRNPPPGYGHKRLVCNKSCELHRDTVFFFGLHFFPSIIARKARRCALDNSIFGDDWRTQKYVKSRSATGLCGVLIRRNLRLANLMWLPRTPRARLQVIRERNKERNIIR